MTTHFLQDKNYFSVVFFQITKYNMFVHILALPGVLYIQVNIYP